MSKLNDLKRLARDELEKFADRGLSAQTAETAKNLASLICKLDCIEQQDGDGYSRREGYAYHGEQGESYSRRRDSMGRYARSSDYSYHGDELTRAIDEANLHPEAKRELKAILERMGR